MKKQEIITKLEELGHQVDKNLSKDQLVQLLKETAPSEEVIEKFKENAETLAQLIRETTIIQNINGTDRMTVDEMVSGGKHMEDGYKRNSGIIIPKEVLVKLKKTEYTFFCTCLSDKCVIERADNRGVKTFFREFTKEIHGENFAEIAQTFMRSREIKK